MNRTEAIQALAQCMVAAMSPRDRHSQLSYWFTCCEFEENDPEIEHFPALLRAQLARKEMPKNLEDPLLAPLLLDPAKASLVGVKNDYIISSLANFGIKIETIDGDIEALHPCPCCQYLTVSERGAYEICPVCFWEDDGAEHPNSFSMANHMGLFEARANFEEYGACDENGRKHRDPEGPDKYLRLQQTR